MPPKTANKKRKAAKEADQDKYVWLLTFVCNAAYESENTEIMVFSSKERAITAMPKLMDEHCPHGKDWRNGLNGFGRRKEENYLYYQYFGNEIGDDGVLISNEDEPNGDGDIVSVHLKRLQLDPPNAGDEMPVAAQEEEDDDDDDVDDNTGNYGVSRRMLQDSDTLLEQDSQSTSFLVKTPAIFQLCLVDTSERFSRTESTVEIQVGACGSCGFEFHRLIIYSCLDCNG